MSHKDEVEIDGKTYKHGQEYELDIEVIKKINDFGNRSCTWNSKDNTFKWRYTYAFLHFNDHELESFPAINV